VSGAQATDGDPALEDGGSPEGINGTFGIEEEESGLGEEAGGAAERERLSRQLRDTRVQLAMTQTRLTALEQSSTMKFGRTIANAAKKPWPRGALLPRELYKLWRDRGAPKSGAANAANALAQAQLADLKDTGGRFLSQLTAPGALPLGDPALALTGLAGGASCLVVTGAISALGCATLAPDAVVHPLLPHDADIVVEATGADLVIVQASALLPGEPWAHATDPAAADRGRRLARMIVMARALGKPVVLLRDVPHSLMPGIGWLASSCDAVVDGGLGVQLGRFNPLGAAAGRSAEPVYAGARDLREAPAVRALLDALTSADGAGAPVRVAGGRSWRALPALYRQHAVLVTASASQALEMAASGARVVGPIGSGTGEADVREQLAAARSASPLTLPEIRAGLRDTFAEAATPVRLAALAAAGGLSASLVGGRQVAVLARAADADAAVRLAAGVTAQRLRPAEVVVSAASGTAAAVRSALGVLDSRGIRVVVTEAPSADGDWVRSLASRAAAPWLAPWPAGGQPGEDYLLDLACARECAQADAVGLADADYEFTWRLDSPALVRASLLAPGGPPAGDWGSHGLRLFTVAR
jgi:hypothetical protein